MKRPNQFTIVLRIPSFWGISSSQHFGSSMGEEDAGSGIMRHPSATGCLLLLSDPRQDLRAAVAYAARQPKRCRTEIARPEVAERTDRGYRTHSPRPSWSSALARWL